jgi:malate dehydrogenase
MYSFPVRCRDGEYEIVQGLAIDEFSRGRLVATANELKEERAAVLQVVA